ncbi:hypothetical protein N7532_008656 [Penicillium argentinense]|uniref:Uncharacterized protein n=1 Tax=Penicillium argentinense TaxID=1131581 RepID=A0A9W9K2R1_9EURO|nr:uncharacterized protein N7532_008656 [Penicillium argentinense]KAJ5089972.1 hypothetical protein N7532_008656 [Penicillium argentinense]
MHSDHASTYESRHGVSDDPAAQRPPDNGRTATVSPRAPRAVKRSFRPPNPYREKTGEPTVCELLRTGFSRRGYLPRASRLGTGWPRNQRPARQETSCAWLGNPVGLKKYREMQSGVDDPLGSVAIPPLDQTAPPTNEASLRP